MLNDLTIDLDVSYSIVPESDNSISDNELLLIHFGFQIYREKDVERFSSPEDFYKYRCQRSLIFEVYNKAFYDAVGLSGTIGDLYTETEWDSVDDVGILSYVGYNPESSKFYLRAEYIEEYKKYWDALNEHVFFEDASDESLRILIETITNLLNKMLPNYLRDRNL